MLLTETTTRISTGQITVLAIGPWDRGEFSLARAQVSSSRSWTSVPDRETASVVLNSEQMLPELILLAQPLPGTYQQRDVEQLRRAAPLAQIVVVAGTWCEGELRTGKPLTGVLRLYWYELVSWWQNMQRSPASWSLCLDGPIAPRATDRIFDDGLMLDDCCAIHSRSVASCEALANSLASYGIECVWTRHESELPRQIGLGLWDGGQLDPKELNRLQVFAAAIHERQGSVVVLLDFPRKEHFSQLGEIGITTVLGKPYNVEELAAACGLAAQIPLP